MSLQLAYSRAAIGSAGPTIAVNALNNRRSGIADGDGGMINFCLPENEGAAPCDAPQVPHNQDHLPQYEREYVVDTSRGSHHVETKWQHLYVLPVLLMEFLALALTRAVLPSLLLQQYGDRVYIVMGVAECVRGLLAFIACPLFGKISDVLGRRICLFITVMGTCAPACSLAFFRWDNDTPLQQGVVMMNLDADPSSLPPFRDSSPDDTSEASGLWSSILQNGAHEAQGIDTMVHEQRIHPHAITVFIVLLALSGIFSSTFTLVFAYISDTVRQQDERVSAYGLALATFGLSFTIGPMAGGYLAREHKQYVFLCSLGLSVVDLLYIYLILPESRPASTEFNASAGSGKSTMSLMTMDHNFSWNPWDSIKIVAIDPFLRKVGQVAFLYYTGLWAVISTFSVYSVKRFHLGPERLGELMSALGLCTIVAEVVLVRFMVPLLGEKRAMKVGLVSFALQCVVLGFAYETWHLFACVFFSLLGNMVYPSLTSLVSGSVEPDAVGEALGAVNGIKALTEGIGPLVFGSLMTLSEKSPLPGWPYVLASVLVAAAYKTADELPDTEDDDYVHELEQKGRRQRLRRRKQDDSGILISPNPLSQLKDPASHEDTEEYDGLLSEVDESDFEEMTSGGHEDLTRLPKTFGSILPSKDSPIGPAGIS